jgi:hypothetical protein
MAKIYTATLLLSAALLFMVEPMFAKMVMPKLGGSPAVWNTAVVFYQVALLAGYVYAHAATTWIGARRQSIVHLAVLMLPLLVLPMAIPVSWNAPASSNPVGWMLILCRSFLDQPNAPEVVFLDQPQGRK